MTVRDFFVDLVLGRHDTVYGFPTDGLAEKVGLSQHSEHFRQVELDRRMQLRQQNIADLAVGSQDEDRFERRQNLLVALFPGHVPHPPDIAVPVEHQDPLRSEPDMRVTEGLGGGRGPRQEDRQSDHGAGRAAHAERCPILGEGAGSGCYWAIAAVSRHWNSDDATPILPLDTIPRIK